MEKHWKSVVSRSVCDYFFDEQRKVGSPEDMPPIITAPHHYLISIHRASMFFVAVCTTEGLYQYLINYYFMTSSRAISHERTNIIPRSIVVRAMGL